MGIEPTYKGFADLSLTTWVPRPGNYSISNLSSGFSPETPCGCRGLNIRREFSHGHAAALAIAQRIRK